MLKRLAKKIVHKVCMQNKIRTIKHLVKSGLPHEVRPALLFLVTGKMDNKTASVVKIAEDRRAILKAAHPARAYFCNRERSWGISFGLE